MCQVRQEVNTHLQNLPDLAQLPSVKGGLAPLPSAGDLFTVGWFTDTWCIVHAMPLSIIKMFKFKRNVTKYIMFIFIIS